MTVSIRIAGKVVHVSGTAPKTAQVNVGDTVMLRRVRLDAAACQALRTMLVAEMGSIVQRMADPLVVEEAAKRVESGRWSLHVVDAPQLKMGGAQGEKSAGGGTGSGSAQEGKKKSDDALKEKPKTWVEVELLDKNKHPVKGLKIELTLPDGSVAPGTLSDKGTFRKDGIDAGSCKVRFPDLDGREWAKASCFADGAPVSLFKGPVKLPAGPHTVVQGDHIASIAADAGFLSWKTVWDDGKNASLKSKRNPNVLYPGDIVEIPAKQKREESVPTTEYSTFQTIGEPVQLRIVVLDWAGNPIADEEVNIQVEGGEGPTSKKVIDPQASKEGKLKVKGYGLDLKLGHLDPVEEISGQTWRLNNLGYRAGKAADPKDLVFLSAVEEFQCDHSLTVDGICGPGTQGKLKEIHGS